jgi:hypothetical protein
MKQLPFADAEYTGNRMQIGRDRFRIEMAQVVP